MIDGSEKRDRQLTFELQNSHVCEKRSKKIYVRRIFFVAFKLNNKKFLNDASKHCLL